LPADEGRGPGLRELKKARTRTEIQRQALQLFRRQGYPATTVEQIAAAAEVSQSTFFRYFPSKEDLVLWDEYDPRLLAALREQPPELSPIGALRAAMLTVFGQLTAEELALEQDRGRLINAVPELRARSLDFGLQSVDALADALAERVGRSAGDFEVRNVVGAVMGALLTAWLAVAKDPDADMVALADAALAHLEAGLPL
jgi:AcrR family transcriptional regulator